MWIFNSAGRSISVLAAAIWLAVCAFPAIVPAFEEVPELSGVQVQTRVVRPSPSQPLQYIYKIGHSAQSRGTLRRIEIDISRSPGSVTFDSSDLTFQLESYQDPIPASEAFDFPRKSRLIIVGSHVPTGWSSGRVFRFSSGDPEYEIPPGQSISGLVMFTRALPAIRDATAIPSWIYTCPESCSDEDDQLARQIEEQIKVHLRALGPIAPPKECNPLDWLDEISKMMAEARTLGWIRNDQIVQTINAKFSDAKTKVLAGNKTPGITVLRGVIALVEQVGCPDFDCPAEKQLTSEALAIVKYNTEYAIHLLKPVDIPSTP